MLQQIVTDQNPQQQGLKLSVVGVVVGVDIGSQTKIHNNKD